MNAVERLEAAIMKLNELKAERGYLEHSGRLVEENPDDRGGFLEPPEPFIPITNDEIMVVLHRTVDAQLAILQHVLKFYRGDLGISTNRHVVALADAILGSTS